MSVHLTPRQREAVLHRANGLTSRQGAKLMGVKQRSFDYYLRKAFQILDVHSAPRAVAVLMALELIDRHEIDIPEHLMPSWTCSVHTSPCWPGTADNASTSLG